MLTHTIYPSSVKRRPTGKRETVIKRSTNHKLGKRVTRGIWRDLPLYTLTLEERATCPRSCTHWGDCYGNNMPFATRYQAGATIEAHMEHELGELQRKLPKGFIVRLHVLGDFYSVSYVARWAQWLGRFPALRIFGYTARLPGTPIGDAILTLRLTCPDRFKMRFSGLFDESDAVALSIDDPRAQALVTAKRAIPCPEQTGHVANCGDCGLCWTADKAITFATH